MTELDELVETTTRGSLILLLGQVSGTVILAIGMLLVARFLGPSEYGSFNKAQSVVQIVLLLMNLGLPAAMTKYLAQYRHEKQESCIRTLIEAGAYINLGVSTFLTVVLYFSSGVIANRIFNDPVQEQYIKYLSVSIVGQAFLWYSLGITQGYERMELRSLINIVYNFAKSILSPVLVYIGFGTLGAIIGHAAPKLLSGLIGVIFVIYLYRSNQVTDSSLSRVSAVKQLLTYGFPLYLQVILNGLLPKLYTTLLGVYSTDTEIGNYSVAINFTVLLSFVTMPIGTTIFPLFSKLDTDKPELEFLYRNAVKYSTLFAYPIIFTLMALASPIIQALYQYQYTYASTYLRLYILSYTWIGLGSVCNPNLLNSQERTDLTFKSTLIRFIIALPLSLIAIKHYGVYGLILTFFTSMATNTIIDYYNIHRHYKYTINTCFLAKILCTSIITYTIIHQAINQVTLNPWIELIIGGILSLTLYLTGFIATKALTLQDLNYINTIADNLGPLKPVINKTTQILAKYL